MKPSVFFTVSSIIGFLLFLLFVQSDSPRFLSLFLPNHPKRTEKNGTLSEHPTHPYLYGVNVDISQILPTSQRYILNDDDDDLIDIAAGLGITLFRITNNTKSFDTRSDALYTAKEWKTILDKMQKKRIKALIVIETAGTNPNLYKETIHDEYLDLVNDYIIDSDVLFHPTVYGIDLKNEPILNEHNVSMIREAAHMIKKVQPDTALTVGWWGVKTGKKDDDGDQIIYWEDNAAGKQLHDFIDFYSLHIYGFDKQTFGLHSDPYTYTKQYISNVKRDLHTKKPILVGEFGAANGQAISDQETVGSPQLQANAYAGVYEALVDLDDPQVIGAVSYQFHSQSRNPDAWAIVKENGNSLLPAAYVLQKFATGSTKQSFSFPMDPVPDDYLFDMGDNKKQVTLHTDDRIGFTLSLDPSEQYRAATSDTAVLSQSQTLTYNKERKRYHAVFRAKNPGKATIVVRRITECEEDPPCDNSSEKVFLMRFTVEG